MRWLGGLLLQHDYEERHDGPVSRSDGLRFDSGRRVRVYRGACCEAQPLGLSEAISRMGPLLHLPALRESQPTGEGELTGPARHTALVCHVADGSDEI